MRFWWQGNNCKWGDQCPRPVAVVLVLALVWAFAFGPEGARGAAGEEERLFNAAAKAFNDGFYERADRELGDFIRLYPNSDRGPEAILVQAQARFKLRLYGAAQELLTTNWSRAGTWSDHYRYWMAESSFARTNYADAAGLYAQLVKDYPQSALVPQAALGEAFSWYHLGRLTNVVQLLRQPEGAFQVLARAQPTNEFVLRGHLLLAEALTQLGNWSEARQLLTALPGPLPLPELEWQRQWLLVRVTLETGETELALNHVQHLLRLAETGGLKRHQPEAFALQGEVWERRGQVAEAITAFQQNLGETVPESFRLQALIKITDLFLKAQQSDRAAASLTQLIESFPQHPARDQWRLRLGELQLLRYRQLLSTAPRPFDTNVLTASSNLLQQALSQGDQVVARFTNSPVLGQAHLHRGWCLWEADRLPESQVAFQAATQLLPAGPDRNWAQFKWADSQYRLGDWAAATTNFQQLLSRLETATPPDHALTQQALHQLVRVEVDRDQLDGATRALRTLLNRYPTNASSDRLLLLVGQMHHRKGQPISAREILGELISRYATSTNVPEAKIAIARSFAQEGKFSEALEQYQQWTQTYPTNPALPRVEFYRAWTYDQAGQSSNALAIFTNLVVRFQEDPLYAPKAQKYAPEAQNWIGDYFFNQGQYPKAEENYQILYQKWTNSPLFYPARLMAGRSAFLRQGFDDAIGYFTNLINDARCPANTVDEAFFNLGDTLMNKPATNLTTKFEAVTNAIVAFAKIPHPPNNPTNLLAPLAWGKIAECYLQLAAQDTNQYANASNYFSLAQNSTLSNWRTRCQAEVGLAIVCEALAKLDPSLSASRLAEAQNHYLNVLYEKQRRPQEDPDPFWLETAGLKAALLYEAQQDWHMAVKVYQRLEELLPARGAVFAPRRQAALRKSSGP